MRPKRAATTRDLPGRFMDPHSLLRWFIDARLTALYGVETGVGINSDCDGLLQPVISRRNSRCLPTKSITPPCFPLGRGRALEQGSGETVIPTYQVAEACVPSPSLALLGHM